MEQGPDELDRSLPGTLQPLTRPGTPRALLASPSLAADRRWMGRAFERALEARSLDEVPVGAVLVQHDRLVAEAFNRTRSGPDPTAHAEVEVLRRGAAALGDWRLDGCTLYVTLEPCAQCAGSIVLSRIRRVVYAAPDPKAGWVGSLGNLLQDRRLNHRVEVTRGVLEDGSADLLRGFFRERR